MGTETYATAPTSAAPSTPAQPVAGDRPGGDRSGPESDTGLVRWRTEPTGESAGESARAAALGPEPRLRQLMGVCGWAAVLGGLSLVVGVRGLVGVLAADPPGWYQPAVIAVGLAGIALTVGAFLTVQRARLPWALLGGSTAFMIAALVLTANAF